MCPNFPGSPGPCPGTTAPPAAWNWFPNRPRVSLGQAPVPIRWVLIRDPKGELDTQSLLCTDQAAPPAQIFEWFSLRWQLEVTYQEVRIHLGVDTQRQWSDRAIARTTPILMGLFPGSPWPPTHFSRAVQSPSAPRLVRQTSAYLALPALKSLRDVCGGPAAAKCPPVNITHASGNYDCFKGVPVRSVLHGMMSGLAWR